MKNEKLEWMKLKQGGWEEETEKPKKINVFLRG